MASSSEFSYVECVLPAHCLRAMHNLTLSTNEWGGQFQPRIQDGRCALSCDDVKLIEGTGLAPHSDDKFYKGDRKDTRVLIAVTPFYREVFQKSPMCDGSGSINMFFHTHPLVMGSYTQGRLSPPSLGDLFAHSILSNSRNYRQNRQLNTCMVMAFEGLYIYYVLPHRFRQAMDMIDELIAQYRGWTPEEREMWKVGEAPGWVVERVKQHVFDELREGTHRFSEKLREHVAEHPAAFDIEGAPIVKDALWDCKACDQPALDFGMARHLGSESLVSFAKENPLLEHMHSKGFGYDFYPAPYDADLTFLAWHTARMVNNRKA